MLKFQNFCRPPGQPRFSAPFSWAMVQKSKFRSQRFVCLVDQISKRCNMSFLPQNPPEEIDLAETRFFGVRAWLRGPQGTCPKITCKELSRPWKFCADLFNGSKVTALFRSDTRTHRRTDSQTKTNHLSTTTEFFFFAYTWGGRMETLQTLQNFYPFTLWRINNLLTKLRFGLWR